VLAVNKTRNFSPSGIFNAAGFESKLNGFVWFATLVAKMSFMPEI